MYFEASLNPELRRNAVGKAMAVLSLFKFDSIVVTGHSGVSFGGALAYAMDKKLVIVRKDIELNRDVSHAERKVETDSSPYYQYHKYIIVDDFVDGGYTLRRILEAISESNIRHAKCIGFWGYTSLWRSRSKYWDEQQRRSELMKELGVENLNLLDNFED